MNLEALKLKICAVELLRSDNQQGRSCALCSVWFGGRDALICTAACCILFWVVEAKIHPIYSYSRALAGIVKVEKIKQKQEVLEVLMERCSEVYLARSRRHTRHSRRFSSCLRGQVQLWLSLPRFVVLGQKWRNKHIHTHPRWMDG